MISVLILLLAACTLGNAQTSREFDAVSVKPMQQTTERILIRSRSDPTMIEFTALPLRTYVLNAYGLKPWEVVVKGPAWILSDRYDISAHTTEPASHDEMMLMLRKALADRFHLRVHKETREVSVYFLTVSRPDARLKPVADVSGPNLLGQRDEITAYHLEMPYFADTLSRLVTDRPVLDRTGLTQEFQFKMQFAATDDDSGTRPSIYTALTDQLGLKLTAGNAPIEVLVIDTADRPSEN